jgi:hypothetical protein
MRLLVSVRDEIEAAAALDGGADIVDAKEPSAGPLGRVSLDVFRAITRRVGGPALVTAALGDATDERHVEREAAAYVGAGAALVKVGFGGIADVRRIEALIAAAVRGGGERVVAVAYADYLLMNSASPDAVLNAAIRAGAAGILIDTADKHGPGLLALMPRDAIRRVVAAAHRAGVLAALAGKLTADELPFVRDAGADVAGVRGAACEGGRTGPISVDRITHLLRQLGRQPAATTNSSAATIVGTIPGGRACSK